MNLHNRQVLLPWIVLICASCQAEPPQAGPHGQSELLSPEQARALFKRCGEEVLQLRSFECDLAYDFQGVMDGGSTTARAPNRYRLTYAQPNLLRIEPLPNQSGLMDSDVPHVFSAEDRMSFYLPRHKRYASIDAPDGLKEFIEDDEVQQNVGTFRTPLRYLRMVLPTQQSHRVAAVKHVRDSIINDVRLRVLEVRFASTEKDSDEFSYNVSVESEAPHLPRLIVSERPFVLPKEATEDLGMKMPYTRKVSTTRLDWRINQELARKDFTFEPAPGVARVELNDLFGIKREGEGHAHQRPSERVGQPAVDFELPSLVEGSVALKSHLGKKVVVLDFWATWCVPCIRAMPQLVEVAEHFGDRGVVVYAVNQKEKKETVLRFIKRKGWDIPVLLDLDGAVGRQFGADAIPTTVIIDQTGVIRYWHQGFTPELGKELAEVLETLIN